MKSVLRVFSTFVLILILLFTNLPVHAGSYNAAVFNSIEFVANIETIGVIVRGTGLPDTAELFYRQTGETEWRTGHPLMRIKDGRLVGSLFHLLPDTAYEIFVFDGVNQVSGSVSTQSDQLSFTPASILYVDDDAGPGGDGSIIRPFQTIQDAVDHAGPGTRVSVADGLYREAVTFSASGAPDNWIQVKAEGAAAVLDSASYLTGDIWREDAVPNVWSTSLRAPVSYVARDGMRQYQYEDKKGILDAVGHEGAKMDEGWFYEFGTQRLYVRSLDDPANYTWQVPRLNRAFNIAGQDWIWIEGFKTQYYSTSTNGCGICTLNASHIVIRNNEIRNSQIGIYTEWTSGLERGNDTRIEGNNVSDPKGEWPWEAVKSTRMEGTAILVRGHTGTIVRDNIVHDYFNGIFTGSSAAGISEYGEVAFDVDVYHNYIYNIVDDAFEAEGACVNHRFRNNTVDKSFVGVSIAPVTQGPTWVLRSTFTNYTGRAIKFSDNSAGIVLFYHNSGWTSAPRINDADLITPVSNVKMRNNIFQGAGYSIYEVPKGSLNNDWNHNNWYSSSAGPRFKWESLDYSTLAGLCNAGGLECNGYDDFPEFADPLRGDFTLLPTSPNIDRGVPLPGINDGFVGDAPDMGAFEYVADLPPTVVASTRADPNPTKSSTVNFDVTFSNRVSGVDLAAPFEDFRLTSNIPGAAITSVMAVSESIYRVHVNAGRKNGKIRLDVIDHDNITDAAGNPLGGVGIGNGDFTAGETYVIHKSITTVKTSIFKSQPSYDGWVLESGESTNRGGGLDKGATTISVGDDAKNQQYRGILSFDTSPLPNDAVILQVQLKIRQQGMEGSDPFGTHGNLLAEIRSGTFNNNPILQLEDFSAAPTPGYVWDVFRPSGPSWYIAELHNVNLVLIDKAGTTQFRLFFSKDDDNDLQSDLVKLNSGNSLISNLPQLMVSYYVP